MTSVLSETILFILLVAFVTQVFIIGRILGNMHRRIKRLERYLSGI